MKMDMKLDIRYINFKRKTEIWTQQDQRKNGKITWYKVSTKTEAPSAATQVEDDKVGATRRTHREEQIGEMMGQCLL